MLKGLGSRKEAAIDSIHDRLRTNLFTAEESTVEAFDGIFAALDSVKLEVDVALRIGINCNVNDVTIFFFALSADVILQLLNPGITLFTEAAS